MNRFIRPVAAAPEKRRHRALHRLLFGRRFFGDTACRLLILFEPNRISYASVFPFLDYAQEFRARYDVDIRCMPVEDALQRGIPDGLSTATHVLAQTWLTDPKNRHEKLERLLAELPDSVTKAYLDSFANNDLRWGGIFESTALYYKKSVFTDLSQFTRPTYGHTNLTEYYGRLYGLEDETTDWGVPPSVLSKLRLAPNFLTDPDLSAGLRPIAFLDRSRPACAHGRPRRFFRRHLSGPRGRPAAGRRRRRRARRRATDILGPLPRPC